MRVGIGVVRVVGSRAERPGERLCACVGGVTKEESINKFILPQSAVRIDASRSIATPTSSPCAEQGILVQPPLVDKVFGIIL